MTHDDASRRAFMAAGLAGAIGLLLVRPAGATPEAMADAIAGFAEGEIVEGRVTLEIPLLVENGNSVPLTVSVESPMTPEDHVEAIAVFNERNPLPDIARFHIGPESGVAKVAVRIRLNDSQRVIAVARMSDGSLWSGSAQVIVTAPACAET
jgi:sulfur-oxidizing protein SoxY